MEFEAYVETAFRRMGLAPVSTDQWPSLKAELQPLLDKWRQVVVYYVLRLLLAPLWEALILLDRLLFLRERGHPSTLVPLFDPTLSPRNYAVVGVKRWAWRGGVDSWAATRYGAAQLSTD